MASKFLFNNRTDEYGVDSDKNDFCLSEIDFYPPSDNRFWKSNINDISGGDNFADYCDYLFNVLDEEEYFDN